MRKGFLNNISWIFFGNVLHAIFAFSLNILTARLLTTDDYGLLNYAASLISFFSSVVTLGLSGMITRMFAEDEDHAGVYLSTGIIARVFASLVAIVILLVPVYFAENREPALFGVVLCQSLGILFSAFDLFIYWYRYQRDAKFVAIARFIGFGISAIVKLVALICFHSIVLYALGVSVETLVMVSILFFAYRKANGFCWQYDKIKFHEMLHISYPFIFSSIMVTIYAQTDKIMLKVMIDTSSVAYYSVAVVLAGAFSIIPSALIEGFRPEIMSLKFEDEDLYQKRMRQVYALVFWLSTLYCVGITIFARPIILLLYGEKYLPAVPALALVVWYSAFSYFGGINNMYLVAESKTVWVQIVTLFGALFNVIANFLLIPTMSIVGAALASLLTQIISNFVLYMIIPALRPAFRLMVQGILCQNIDIMKLVRIFIK